MASGVEEEEEEEVMEGEVGWEGLTRFGDKRATKGG